ncbi:conserved hypothetical protein [Paecilomyces variotii No. 5]|uniref:Uncharacterized protein n=1 Tax=Byssochlamys spectabilis (strain No. 5 / NBRC 109023) TaxID=1356009 RepID=V5G3F8_BYSSN|nr:conserved hypothetical protein [Paecilomyces variotii No. 5]
MTAIDRNRQARQSLMDPSIAHGGYSSQHPSLSRGPGSDGAEIAEDAGLRGAFARRTLGICLLLLVVVLWTASNFLASTIFADNTYSKPFFLTYVNTSLFILPLIPIIAKRFWKLWRTGRISHVKSIRSLLGELDWHDSKEEEEEHGFYHAVDDEERLEGDDMDARRWSLRDPDFMPVPRERSGKLGLRATARLSFEFCLLWFMANYFAMACLQYTTVGSATILTSTSGVWTLVFGAVIRVEKVTLRKFFGVFASLVGIILISRVDLSSSDDPTAQATDEPNPGSFPHKTPGEIALGDAMAAFSAIVYGIYTIVMKKQVGDESRVNMQLFFGLVGLFNTFLLWPGFIILHFTGVEQFAFPDTSRVWMIILVNSVTSLVSDICWAYAMLLTTPLVVTVGLSLTIPLSLVGQIILQDQYASPLYWVGAVIVFLSFLLVNHESGEQVADTATAGTATYIAAPREDREDFRT